MRLPPLLRNYRNWLLWALALAPAPAAAQTLPGWPSQPPRFYGEIQAFGHQDQVQPPTACPVLFVGSSSIRMWNSLAADMAPLPVLNRGFGGAELADVNRWFDDVIGRYRPRAIVLYAGENDLDAGKTPAQVVADFEQFLALKEQKLGATPVFFTSLKPSQLRIGQLQRQAEVNQQVRALAERRHDLEFVDVAPLMMQDGQPRPLYIGDGLHMNADGYALWAQTIGGALLKAQVEALPCDAQTASSPAGRTGPG
jgi:lysophospholipase L1-like esterase